MTEQIQSDHARRVARVIRGDKRTHSKGYSQIYLPFHEAAGRSYVYEHRIVMERTLGRLLSSDEHVHHLNGDVTDNRPANLALVTGSAHRIEHLSGIDDGRIVGYLRRGWTQRQIVALGVSGHRVVRIRQQLRSAA